MTRYRTRSREVEAVQWMQPGDHPGVWSFPDPAKGAIIAATGDDVHPTDWIVTDCAGHRIVKADDFAEQFEEIGNE